MFRSIEIRWLALSGAALAMGVLLSWLTYVRSEAILDGARALSVHESGRQAPRKENT